MLLQHNLIHAVDIRTCPSLDCSYAGVLPLFDKDSGIIDCGDPLVCEMCGIESRDPIQRDPHGITFLIVFGMKYLRLRVQRTI